LPGITLAHNIETGLQTCSLQALKLIYGPPSLSVSFKTIPLNLCYPETWRPR
jgi:hypothetical protein